MAPAPSSWSRFAAPAAALGLLFALGCSGKNDSATKEPAAVIKGTITYTRPPLAVDANGVPTGLDTDPAHLQTLPLRGVSVRAYQLDTSGSSPRWVLRKKVATDADGKYLMQLSGGKNYLVQVESFVQPTSNRKRIAVIADPNGLSSTEPQISRPLYLLRASPDGVAATSTNLTPTGDITAGGVYVSDFTITAATPWLVGPLELNPDASAPLFTSASLESSPSGSRVAAILDTIAQVGITYGDPSPGAPLDLHYLVGRSESAGTYIEYRPLQWVLPGGLDLAYDAASDSDHLFGSIQGGAANDDAYDSAVLYQLMGRSFMFSQYRSRSLYGPAPFGLLPPGSPQVDGLSPDQALVEGMPLILAANLLKSPYLADTDGTSALLGYTDIRDYSGVASSDVGPYSPRTLARMFWDIDLAANGVTNPTPGPTEWATINPAAIVRVFGLSAPKDATTSVLHFIPLNAYEQLALLQKKKTSTEPVDLAAIFTDTAINTISSVYNMPWPQPSTTAFGQTWTTSATNGPYTYSGTLSMASDHQVGGVYVNEAYQEIAYLGLTQSSDQAYQLTLQTTPNPLPAGATIQVVIFSNATTTAYTFTGTNATPIPFTLAGNGNTTSPLQYPVMVRLLSPTTLQSDIPFTLTLAPAPPGTLRGPVLGR